MKIKNLNINKTILIPIVVIGIAVGATIGYCSYNYQHQICEENTNDSNIFMNENGDICRRFDIGEHVIEISRNDAFYRKIESVEGYYIDEVEINSWKYNNKVKYVNMKPVIAVSTSKNGQLEFNDFGTVEKEKSK